MAQTIEHVVVLMMENRSFDHMCGFLTKQGLAIDGLTGNESNPTDPQNPATQIPVSADAPDVLSPDPGHSFADVNQQLFNNPAGPPPVGKPNRGFVYSYSHQLHVTPAIAANIMKCFEPTLLPALTGLAKEFALCDRWFCSLPGPTWPNRFFAHAATSKGYVTNSLFHNYDMPTVFENLTSHGLSWKNYFHDFSLTWYLSRLQAPAFRNNYDNFNSFKKDANKGTLPNYSFIEPQYFSFLTEANDQHPPHSVSRGDQLIAGVYHAVRNSPVWSKTILLVTWDEHGGTYDHVMPPASPPPDGNTSQFGFDRYGPRVPAIVISPFIPKRPSHVLFDHASIPATLKRVFGLPDFLTERDRNANTFDVLASLKRPRHTPESISSVPLAEEPEHSALTQEEVLAERVSGGVSDAPLTDLQKSIVDLADHLNAKTATGAPLLRAARRTDNEYNAAVYIREVARQFVAK